MFYIVPNHVREAIYAVVDARLELYPDFDRHGEIPNFELAVNAAGEKPTP